MKKTIILFFCCFIFFAAVVLRAQEAQVLQIFMSSAVEDAVKNSSKLKSVEMEAEALKQSSYGQRAALNPKLSFDAGYRYVTEVPSLNVPMPGLSGKKLSDNVSYSAGPVVSWTVWDNRASRNSWMSALEQSKSKEEEARAVKKQVILAARTAYFQVQLALEQVKLLGDYLVLSQAQQKDIKLNYEAGTKSKIDELMASQEVLSKKRLLRQARADLASALRDLMSLTGNGKKIDVSLPYGSGPNNDLPPGIEPATVFLSMDSINDSLKTIEKFSRPVSAALHPGITSLANSAGALKFASESLKSGLWPKIQFSAKSSIDYPNGPDFTSFNQNSLNISAAFPIFEWRRTRTQSSEQNYRALSVEMRREQLEKDMLRDRDKAMDQLSGLTAQQEINRQYVMQAEELARLVYSSYRAGRSTFLEVQTANTRALEAKIQSLRTDIQVLMQLAVLENLSG